MRSFIDLSIPLTHQMPVFPGDPEVSIEEIHKLDKEGWRLRQLSFTTHLGTHLNVPFHMVEKGKTLDQYNLNDFIGKSILFGKNSSWDKETGLIFAHENITKEICDQLINNPPKFVGLSKEFDFDLDLEKKLLENNILSYENLVSTEKLPKEFMFFGVPLNMPGADGSPVRAFAMVEEI